MPRTGREWSNKNHDAKIPDRVRDRVIKRSKGKCAQCGRTFGLKLSPEMDHVVALINGGMHREENLRAVCVTCHKTKTKQDRKEQTETGRGLRKAYGLVKPPQRPVPKRPKKQRIKTAWWTKVSASDDIDGQP